MSIKALNESNVGIATDPEMAAIIVGLTQLAQAYICAGHVQP